MVDLGDADRRRIGGGAVAQLLGGRSEQVAERYRLASPIERRPLAVPQLLVHGVRDRHVLVDLGERYAEAAQAAGDAVDLAVRHDVGHMDLIEPRSPGWSVAVDWLSESYCWLGTRRWQPAVGFGHVAGGGLSVVVVSSAERRVARVAVHTSWPTACPLNNAARSAKHRHATPGPHRAWKHGAVRAALDASRPVALSPVDLVAGDQYLQGEEPAAASRGGRRSRTEAALNGVDEYRIRRASGMLAPLLGYAGSSRGVEEHPVVARVLLSEAEVREAYPPKRLEGVFDPRAGPGQRSTELSPSLLEDRHEQGTLVGEVAVDGGGCDANGGRYRPHRQLVNLWRVRVDLFAVDDDGRRVGRAVNELRRILQDDGRVTNTDLGGDQGLGITGRPVVGLLFWVGADDVGEAGATAVRAARRAGAAHRVGPDLYDVTVIPMEAVVRPGDPGYPAMPD